MRDKRRLKSLLGELPLAAELDWFLRQRHRPRRDHFSLERLKRSLPEAVRLTKPLARAAAPGRRILFFATLHYWIEQAAYITLVLAARGHEVTLMTLPYAEWHREMDPFTQRQRNLHARDALKPLTSLATHVSLLDLRPHASLPPPLQADVEEISLWDVQYTLMREDVDIEGRDRALYDLRRARNTFAARAALTWMQRHRPDVALIPNGLILEMGVIFRVARFLGLPAVTYEFSDQREQVWLAHDSPIMQQNTDDLWQARRQAPLTEAMYQRLADLENARRGARAWGKSDRLWQYVSAQGGEATRRSLGLDERPVVLLAANVLGDSLTLGRDLFAASMGEWITRTVRFFADHPEVQFVVRVHPGERIVPQAQSMADVVREALPELPEHIRIVGADDPVNTYDLIEIAALGLVYTTTVGMEMAMTGLPVIVCGKTHYRGRGFTLDPDSWEAYFETLTRLLSDLPGHRLSEEQVSLAWNYAYRFFFEYPRPFPWRLMGFWDDLQTWPLARVLSEEGRARFDATFDALTGAPIAWDDWRES